MGYLNPGSMTFWTGCASIGFGVWTIIQGDFDNGMQSIMAGLGMIFLRRAISNP